MMFRTILISFVIFGISSCEKPEKAIQPYDRGNAKEVVISMTGNYRDQVFYSLDSGRVVKTVNRMDWDFAFDCSDSMVILTNNGRGIYVAEVKNQSYEDLKDTAGLDFYWGQPSLDQDSLAFGKWWIGKGVFVVNLGLDLNGEHLGFIKCKPELTSEQSLQFTWSKLEENQNRSLLIPKDKNFNFVYFSVLNNRIVPVEPNKKDWDIVFTQYVKLLFDPPYPATRNYEVVGALINSSRLEVGYDFKTPFEDITIQNRPSSFFNHRDAIGFDWKWFDIASNSYTVNPSMNYILKSSSGFYYKLHFIDFYNDKGVKGYPKFEIQKI